MADLSAMANLVGAELAGLSPGTVVAATLLSFTAFWIAIKFLTVLKGSGGSRGDAIAALRRIHAVVARYAPQHHLCELDALGAYFGEASVIDANAERRAKPALCQTELQVGFRCAACASCTTPSDVLPCFQGVMAGRRPSANGIVGL